MIGAMKHFVAWKGTIITSFKEVSKYLRKPILSEKAEDKWNKAITKLITDLEKLEPDKANDFINQNTIHAWTGRSIEWFTMELMVFSLYSLTLAILCLKSRFVKVGINNAYQFMPTYMSFMANTILEKMNFKK